MTRRKTLGLCLLTALSLGVFAAPATHAATIGTCIKTVKEAKKFTGDFTTKTCTTLATSAEKEEGKHNEYEMTEAADLKFTSKGGKFIVTGAAGEIACTQTSGEGEFIDGAESTDVLRLAGCTLSATRGACNSAGDEAGEIVITATGLLNEPAAEEAALGLSPSGEEYSIAEFTCEPDIPIYLIGSLSAAISPDNTASKAGKTGGRKTKFSFTTTFADGEAGLIAAVFNPLTDELETGSATVSGEGGIILPVKGTEIKTESAGVDCDALNKAIAKGYAEAARYDAKIAALAAYILAKEAEYPSAGFFEKPVIAGAIALAKAGEAETLAEKVAYKIPLLAKVAYRDLWCP